MKITTGLLLAVLALPLWAGVPSRYEADYAEAVLACRAHDSQKALALVDRILAAVPRLVEALELKALILSSNDDKGAIPIYERLIQLRSGKSGDRDEDAAAPYRFALGRLLQKLGDTVRARAQLEKAAAAGFNPGGCAFFLGMADWEEQKLDEAWEKFQEVVASDAQDLKPAAHVYLAKISAARRDGDSCMAGYNAARRLASSQMEESGSAAASKELAAQVAAAAGRELKALDRSDLMASAGLLMGYDSNILSVPTGVSTGNTTAAASTLQTTALVGLRYATSPVSSWQLVPSYRGSFNYNFDANTKNAQFFLHNVRLLVTRDALADFYYGLKLEGSYAFQYRNDAATGSATLGSYSMTGSFGPYLRFPVGGGFLIMAELYVQPQKFYLDPTFSASLRESGTEGALRVELNRANRRTRWWNPALAVTASANQTSGEEFRSRRVGLDLANTMAPSADFLAALGVGAQQSFFPDRPSGARDDQTATFTFTGGYRLSTSLSILATLQYVANLSSAPEYRYRRLVGNAGVNAVF